MGQSFRIRAINPADRAACGRVYLDAVRNGTDRHYTAEQARAWAPDDAARDWGDRLFSGTTWVADGGGAVRGFLTMIEAGHLDLFFVEPGWRGAGVASALYESALHWARARGHRRLTTHASLLARSFLIRRGWQVIAEEEAARHGVMLTRFEMVLEEI